MILNTKGFKSSNLLKKRGYMNKKYIISTLFFIFFQVIFCITSNADSIPYIYIEDSTKYKNVDEVTINVCVENINSNIVTMGLDIEYDTNKLEYVDSKAGKDLSATIKLAEDMPEENRVAIGIINIGGLKKDGVYYSINFKVKDNSNENIPIKLNVREITDKDGNDIKVNSKDGNVLISSEVKEESIENQSQDSQIIRYFEKTDLNEIENLEDILVNEGNLNITSSDKLTYENSNTDVIEILEDGTIIPNKDGTSNVEVNLNGEKIGNLEVEVEDGKIQKISKIVDKISFGNR
jgi:hypothetical protein